MTQRLAFRLSALAGVVLLVLFGGRLGGKTSGSVTIPRTNARPGKSTLARSHASGRPTTSAIAVAEIEEIAEMRRASVTTGRVSNEGSSDHGTRPSNPMNGRTKNVIPTKPSKTRRSGGRVVAVRRRFPLLKVRQIRSRRGCRASVVPGAWVAWR